MFHIKLEETTSPIIINNKKMAKIFLFLYLCKIKGRPRLLSISILDFVFLAMFLKFLYSFIETFALIIVPVSLLIFHNSIFLFMHMLINLSVKRLSILIFTYPNYITK